MRIVQVADILRPTPSTAEARWKADMCWVFRAPYVAARHDEKCPVWGDMVPYKSVTVVVPADEEDDAAYCLSMAHGGGYSRRKVLDGGRVALRSDYAAW
jgi:hypothetical protein